MRNALCTKSLIRRLRGERGFTLVEMLIGSVLALVVVTATLSFLVAALHEDKSAGTRNEQIGQARSGVDRLVRKLRDATAVTVTSTQSITFTSPGSTAATITCSTTTKTCTQTKSSVTTTLFANVANSDVFVVNPGATSTNATYVTVSLKISATGHADYTLADTANLRNKTLGT